jgi:hypothetical protein
MAIHVLEGDVSKVRRLGDKKDEVEWEVGGSASKGGEGFKYDGCVCL